MYIHTHTQNVDSTTELLIGGAKMNIYIPPLVSKAIGVHHCTPFHVSLNLYNSIKLKLFSLHYR